MEKLVYLLGREPGADTQSLREQLLAETVPLLRTHGARQITLNIADLDAEVQDSAPDRIAGPWASLGAVVAFWLECLDSRGPIETHLASLAPGVSGYLVTESLPQTFAQDWGEGERRPGVSQFTAHGKPEGLDEASFYHNWQVEHSRLSFDLHPRRWSYERNAVARQLCGADTGYRALVLEHFRELRDFTDPARYFGDPAVVEQMYAELPGFCDVHNMVTGPMSEYRFA